MKGKIAVLFFVCAIVVTANAQNISAAKVPVKVMEMFKAKFPGAEKVSWEMESKKTYEANFVWKGTEQSSTFDENGKWVETGVEIKFLELPNEVRQAVNKQFAGWKIGEVSKGSHAIYGLCFEVEVAKGKEKYDLVFSKTGEILSKEDNKEN